MGFWGVTEGRDVWEMQNIRGMHAAGLGMPASGDACNAGRVVLGGCTAQHCVHNTGCVQCGEDAHYGVGGMHASGSSDALRSIREMHAHHGRMHVAGSRDAHHGGCLQCVEDAHNGGVGAMQGECMPWGCGDPPHTMGPSPERVRVPQSRRACGSWSGCRCRRQPRRSPVSRGPGESWPLRCGGAGALHAWGSPGTARLLGCLGGPVFCRHLRAQLR